MNTESVDYLALIAALVKGDRWLSADACAVYLGMVTPAGNPMFDKFVWNEFGRPKVGPGARSAQG